MPFILVTPKNNLSFTFVRSQLIYLIQLNLILLNQIATRKPSTSTALQSGTSEEVRRQRQRADQSKDQPESSSQSRYNTLSLLSSSTPKPLNKSLSLFFFRKGSSRATLHGSPMIIQLQKLDRVDDCQEYLRIQVQDYPAWKSFPNVRTQEIDPNKPICVGYWEGGSTLLNANKLIGGGSINDLLKLVDNPKSTISLPQHGVNKGRKSSELIRIRYTVHIRIIGDDSDEDHHEHIPSSPPTSLAIKKIFHLSCAKAIAVDKRSTTLKSSQPAMMTVLYPLPVNFRLKMRISH